MNHIVFCARTELGPERRTLFGYYMETKYSRGGVPNLESTVYFDNDLKGPCIDVFLDIDLQ